MRAQKKALKILAAGALALLFFHHAKGDSPDDRITPDTPRSSLTVSLANVFGDALQNDATVRVCHRAMPECRIVETAGGEATIGRLPAGLKTPYIVTVSSPAYNDFTDTVKIPPDSPVSLHAALRMDMDKISGIRFPNYDELPQAWKNLLESSNHIEGYENLRGRKLYESFKETDRAVVMNIMAKTGATLLTNGSSVLGHLQEIRRVHPDRIVAVGSPGMKEALAANAGPKQTFGKRNVFAAGFHDPPAGYDKAGGYKTRDAKGNLDIELYENKETLFAELDIDEDNGWAHLKEVVRNTVLGKYTNPVKISQILAEYQNIDPLYRPSVNKKKADNSGNAPVAMPARLR